MSGVFPNSGVAAAQTTGADPTITVDDLNNCAGGPLFHSTQRCEPRFDPAAANFVLSEIVNLVKCAGLRYDCAQFDNLCDAVAAMIANSVQCTGVAPGTFGDSTHTVQVTVNNCGQVTAIQSVAIDFPPGTQPLQGPTTANPNPVGSYGIATSPMLITPGSTSVNGLVTFPNGSSPGAVGMIAPGTWIATSSVPDDGNNGNFHTIWYRQS